MANVKVFADKQTGKKIIPDLSMRGGGGGGGHKKNLQASDIDFMQPRGADNSDK